MGRRLGEMDGAERAALRDEVARVVSERRIPGVTGIQREHVRAFAERLELNISRVAWAQARLDLALFSVFEEAQKQGRTEEHVRAAAGI